MKEERSGANAVGHKSFVSAISTALYDLFQKKDTLSPLSKDVRMDGKNCLVTGANSGLGFAVAKQLASRGAHVMMACRSGIPEAGEAVEQAAQSGSVEMLAVDLSDLSSVEALCDSLRRTGRSIDVFVANAGLMPRKARKTIDGFEVMFAVHFLANRLICARLVSDGLLAESGDTPRIVFVSSEAHQSSDAIDFERFGAFEEYGLMDGLKHYGKSKLHLCTLAQELSRRLNSQGEVKVAVHSLCPGPVASNIARETPTLLKPLILPIIKWLFREPDRAAEPVMLLACDPSMGKKTGVYLHMMREKQPSSFALDPRSGRLLWEMSKDLLPTSNGKNRSLHGCD